MHHVTEDDLVLHYYGELDAAAEARLTAHLAQCRPCHEAYASLQRVLALVGSAEAAPAVPEDLDQKVWARLEPALPGPRRGWTGWFALAPAHLALAAAVAVLVAGAFFAGRITERQSAPPAVSAADLRERILLVDLGEHLDRSQTMLVELVSADAADVLDISVERDRAEELVAANRLYRQTAEATGDTAIRQFLEDLERLLVDVAAGPDELSTGDIDAVRRRIDAEGLLFKVRVLSTAVRERQQQHIAARAGQSS